MYNATTLLETAEVRRIFKNLFDIAYATKGCVLPLHKIMHWQAPRQNLSVLTPDLDNKDTKVFGGYFFNFSTPEILLSEIDEAILAAPGIQYLVPTVRRNVDVTALLQRGFLRVPWFVESIFDITDEIDKSIRSRLTGEKFRRIKKIVSNAREVYDFKWIVGQNLRSEPQFLSMAINLHLQNTIKHNHTVNLYSSDVVAKMVNGSLIDNLLVGIRFHKKSGAPVQAVFCMIDYMRSQLYMLVQGQDYSHNAEGHNLYTTLFYDVYQYAESKGVNTIFLGRGNQVIKRRLGANRFRVLDNWFLIPGETEKEQLSKLKMEAEERYQFESIAKANNQND